MNWTEPRVASWQRAIEVREAWTTVVTGEVRWAAQGRELGRPSVCRVLAQCLDFTADVDAWFSPTRSDAVVRALREGRLREADAPAEVADVIAGCRRARELTDGAFDPWHGGFNPSGYVKGWAADRMAERVERELRRAGLESDDCGVCINAGGDVSCRGAMARGRPWSVGVSHPYRPEAICARVDVRDGAMATSGVTMRGRHVRNPATGRPAAHGITAATVTGPDGGLADALATALVVAGAYGVRFLDRLPEYSALWIAGDRTLSCGPAFELAA